MTARKLHGNIFFDITQLLTDPIRTGIQRVTYEILRYWPNTPQLIPGFISPHTGQPMLVPEAMYAKLQHHFASAGGSRDEDRISLEEAVRTGIQLRDQDLHYATAILNSELFFEPIRMAFYRRLLETMREKIHWIVYDIQPFVRPDLDPPGIFRVVDLMPYLSTLGRIPNLHFISAFSRSEVVNRVLKKSSPRYTVIPLGADSLGQASPNFSASKRTFTYVGSIDPKRNHSVVLDAFKELWVENIDVQLTLIGRIRPDLASLAHELSNLQDTEPRFAWKRGLDDAAVSAIVKESRATIYVSEYEGFGLPPIESLALGTPSIVSRFVPSLESVGTAGTICVEIQKSAIRNAVLRMLDDDYAASKFAEISTLSIPTWKGYAHSLWSAITI